MLLCSHYAPPFPSTPSPLPTHRRPNPKYAPWFNVPLKSARVAVCVINMLAQQARASRVSFPDVVKRLAEEPQESGLFISKKVRGSVRLVIMTVCRLLAHSHGM